MSSLIDISKNLKSHKVNLIKKSHLFSKVLKIVRKVEEKISILYKK